MNYRETDWISIDEIIEQEEEELFNEMDEEEQFALELIYME